MLEPLEDLAVRDRGDRRPQDLDRGPPTRADLAPSSGSLLTALGPVVEPDVADRAPADLTASLPVACSDPRSPIAVRGVGSGRALPEAATDESVVELGALQRLRGVR
jgi:hypothetical protein